MNSSARKNHSAVDTMIWDLDGTILNSFEINVEMWQEVLPRHGFPTPSNEQVTKNYHGTLQDTAIGLAPTATKKQIDAILEDFLKLDNVYIKEADHHLFADAVGLAERARNKSIKQILVTNRAHGINRSNASPRNLVQNSRLNQLIDAVVCGDEVNERKPSRNVLAGILEDSSTALMIGDQYIDAQFALNLGCSAVLVNRGGQNIAHIDKLSDGSWSHIDVVSSLDEVQI